MKKAQILEFCEEKQIKYINLLFTDLPGILKSVTIPLRKLEDAIENNVWFDGSSIEGFARICESDMYLKPDVNTFDLLPWTKDSAYGPAGFVICDIHLPDGTPFGGSPRQILKRTLAKADERGYKFCVGPELEFFLFQYDDNDRPHTLPNDRAGYFDSSTDFGTEIRKDMTNHLLALGIEVETLHHEVAAGQHEIDFKYSDALTTADNTQLFKLTLKAAAQRHGLHASFMPKPIAEINGSGMHTHQSLFKDDENLFYDPEGSHQLSREAEYFVGGQLRRAEEMTCILCPTVNSYKRLVPGYEAPVYISWAQINRSSLIRVPGFTTPEAARIEIRCPDPASNPYLAFSAMLASGLEGIDKKIAPPPAVEENIYEFDEGKLKQYKLGTLPESLGEAIHKLGKSDLMKEMMGEHAFQKYLEARKKEWHEFMRYVSKWELDRYLEYY